MATSGDTILSLTRDQMVTASIRKLGVVAQGQTPDAEAVTNAAQALNLRIALHRKDGLLLWTRKTYSFVPTVNVSSYNIGDGQTLNTPYPLNVIQAYKVVSSGTTRIPMEVISDWNYNRLPQGSLGGAPIQLTYQPKVNYGVLKLWPAPDAASAAATTITIVYNSPIEYFNLSTETLDMPEEWYLALIYNVALDIAPEWGVPLLERQQLAKEAKYFLDTAKENSGEDSSIFFQIERQ